MSKKNFQCKISSSKNTKSYDDLQSITLPTKSGQIQILPSHSESFVLIEKGNIKLKKINGQEETLFVDSGECHIKNNELVIIL